MVEGKVRELIEEAVFVAKENKITRENLGDLLNACYYPGTMEREKLLKAKAVIKEIVAKMSFDSQTRRLFAIDFFYLAYEWQDKGEYIRWTMAKELARRNNMKETTSYSAVGNALYNAKRYLEKELPQDYYLCHRGGIDCNKVLRRLVNQISTLVEERN